MQQRKKQPEVTRKAILKAAGEGFSTCGYAATGLVGIVERAGLTKGALFHHFQDKCSLAEAWISDELKAVIEEEWVGPLSGIESLAGFQGFCRSRCMAFQASDAFVALVAMTAEAVHSEPVLREAAEAVFAMLREAFGDLIQRGKDAGWIHRSIQAPAEAGFVVSTLAGLTVTGKLDLTDASLRAGAGAMEAYLETLRAG